jgi:hypothetical protein
MTHSTRNRPGDAEPSARSGRTAMERTYVRVVIVWVATLAALYVFQRYYAS